LSKRKRFHNFFIPEKDSELDEFLSGMNQNRSEWIREACKQRLLTLVDNRKLMKEQYRNHITTEQELTTEALRSKAKADTLRASYLQKYGADIEEEEKVELEVQVQRQVEDIAAIDRTWAKFENVCKIRVRYTDETKTPPKTIIRNLATMRDEWLKGEIKELKCLGQSDAAINQRICTHIERANVELAAEKEEWNKIEDEKNKIRKARMDKVKADLAAEEAARRNIPDTHKPAQIKGAQP
jgi:hypothetical protein